jgi:hypothetical protein
MGKTDAAAAVKDKAPLNFNKNKKKMTIYNLWLRKRTCLCKDKDSAPWAGTASDKASSRSKLAS